MSQSAILKLKLKEKLPKPAAPEAYKKFIHVMDTSKENWSMKCTLCFLTFKGRAFRANCHVVGKLGEGVQVCHKISDKQRLDFIEQVPPDLLKDEKIAIDEPSTKKPKQSTLSGFVSKCNFECADAEIAKFAYTSGVSFRAL